MNARRDTAHAEALQDSIAARTGGDGEVAKLKTRLDSLKAEQQQSAAAATAKQDSLRTEADARILRLDSLLTSSLANQTKQNALIDSLRRLSAGKPVDLNPPRPFTDGLGDPERDRYFDNRDANFLNASVIKSIAGDKPADEFFDLRFRLQFYDRSAPDPAGTTPGSGPSLATTRPRGGMSVFAIAAIDVALSAVNDSATADSIQQARKKLTEATLALEVGLPPTARLIDGKYVRYRRFFAGPVAKVFSTVPYYGLNLGSVELEGSSFRSSYLFLGYLRRFYPNTMAKRDNVYVEFFLRSSNVDFFKLLSIRGGVLFPVGAGAREEGTVSRIAIEVPVVSWPF